MSDPYPPSVLSLNLLNLNTPRYSLENPCRPWPSLLLDEPVYVRMRTSTFYKGLCGETPTAFVRLNSIKHISQEGPWRQSLSKVGQSNPRLSRVTMTSPIIACPTVIEDESNTAQTSITARTETLTETDVCNICMIRLIRRPESRGASTVSLSVATSPSSHHPLVSNYQLLTHVIKQAGLSLGKPAPDGNAMPNHTAH